MCRAGGRLLQQLQGPTDILREGGLGKERVPTAETPTQHLWARQEDPVTEVAGPQEPLHSERGLEAPLGAGP